MSSYQFTPQAVEDLFEIWSYMLRLNGAAILLLRSCARARI
jgi:hypothetical protein